MKSSITLAAIVFAGLTMSLGLACSVAPTGKSASPLTKDNDACVADSECDSDEVCRAGKCSDAVPCKANSDCLSGEVCNAGECE